MADTSIDIPDRELFKAAEVCDIAGVQPYVLRSWDKEFPALGVVRSPGAQRVYRRADVELVLRIKQLVYGEGLTLAGVRRKLDEERADAGAADAPAVVASDTRKRLAGIKAELKSLLAMIDAPARQTASIQWPPKTGQPTLLDLSADQNDNGRADGAAAEGQAAKRAGKKSRRTPS